MTRDQKTEYIIERSKRRSITLSIKADRTIVVKAPHLVPKFVIDQFITKHQDWITNRLEKLAQRPHRGAGAYANGTKLLYLGKDLSLTYGPYTEIQVVGDKLLVPLALQFRIKKELEAWYVREGRAIITRQVERFAQEMKTSYTSLSSSDTSSKWGSCSHDNRLQFNWRLIMCPLLVLNYVVIHELAHTTEKNHSRAFWAKVALYNPSFRQNRKWLSEHGHGLIF